MYTHPQTHKSIARIVRKPADRHAVTDETGLAKTLARLGADRFDALLPESRYLPRLLQPTETIEGIVYGRYHQTNGGGSGRGALIATNSRVIFLDRKPFYMYASEITYGVVSAISHSHAGFISYVTLNTRFGDISMRTFNQRCSEQFTSAIANHIFGAEPL